MITALIVLIMLSAFFSASETAYSSLNMIRLKSRAEDGDKQAAKVLALAERYDSLLSTILIGNNIVNIGASSLATVLFSRLLGNAYGPTASTIVMTLLVLTFGEIMLRLKAPGHERFFQSPMLEATFGGGEANVAVSLANYGMDAEFLTVLPQNDIADACIRELRYFGVDTKKIVRGEGRMGIYYLEGGANQLPSKVVYDRA